MSEQSERVTERCSGQVSEYDKVTNELRNLNRDVCRVWENRYITVQFTVTLPQAWFGGDGDRAPLHVVPPTTAVLSAGPFPRRSVADAAREVIRRYSGANALCLRCAGGTLPIAASSLAVTRFVVHSLDEFGPGTWATVIELHRTLGDLACTDAVDDPDVEEDDSEEEQGP